MPHPEWLNDVGVDDVLGAVLAIVLIGVLVLAWYKTVHPLTARIGRVLDLILGRPDQQGIPGQPSMMDRFDTLDERMDGQDARLAKIEGQVTPNHGSTTKLAEDVQQLKASLAELIERFENHLKR